MHASSVSIIQRHRGSNRELTDAAFFFGEVLSGQDDGDGCIALLEVTEVEADRAPRAVRTATTRFALKAWRISIFAMECSVKVIHLLSGGLDPGDALNGLEEEESHDVRVSSAPNHSAELLGKELGASSLTTDIFVGKDTKKDRTECTSHTVDTPDVKGVVPLEHVLEFTTEVTEATREEADEEGGPWAHKAGSWGDGGETGDGTDTHADKGWLAVLVPVNEGPDGEGSGGGNLSVNSGKGGTITRGESRATVESEPAEPEECCAESDEGDVVRCVVDLLLTDDVLTGTKVVNGGEGGEASSGVNDDTSGKVLDTPDTKPALWAPDGMAKWAVDDDEPDGDEGEVWSEEDAVGESSGHEGWSDDRKHALVAGEDEARNVGDKVNLQRRAVSQALSDAGGMRW